MPHVCVSLSSSVRGKAEKNLYANAVLCKPLISSCTDNSARADLRRGVQTADVTTALCQSNALDV